MEGYEKNILWIFFTAVKQYRLNWGKIYQTTIRANLYSSIRDSLCKGDTDPSHVSENILLPATLHIIL